MPNNLHSANEKDSIAILFTNIQITPTPIVTSNDAKTSTGKISKLKHAIPKTVATEKDVYKKTLEAHNEHVKFLERIGQATAAAMENARLFNIDAGSSFNITPPPKPVITLKNKQRDRGRSHSPKRPPATAPAPPTQNKHVSSMGESKAPSTAPKKLVADYEIGTQTAHTVRYGIPWKNDEEMEHPSEVKKEIFRNFHVTSGDPPKTPPRVPSEEYVHNVPSSQIYKDESQKKKKDGTKNTDAMFDFENGVHPKAVGRPLTAETYSKIGPKVDTGLSQMQREVRFTPIGLPIPPYNHQPLTLGSRVANPKSFSYEQYKARRAARIKDVTNRLYNSFGSSATSRNGHHLYLVPPHKLITSTRERSQNPTKIKDFMMATRRHLQNQIQIIQSPHSNRNYFGTDTFSAYSFRQSYHNSAISNHHGSIGNPNKLSINTNNMQQQQLQNNAQQVVKTYRPSQLMPLHIPGPKTENIYIGTYSGVEASKKEGTSYGKETPIKSRKR